MLAQFAGIAQVWKQLDGGVEGPPTAICSNNKLLATSYVAGYEKGYKLHQLSIWNGYYWIKLPMLYTDSFSSIQHLAFYKDGLYIAGRINQVLNLPNAKNIIRWRNRNFEDLSGLSSKLDNFNIVNGLQVYKEQLIISGLFKAQNVTYGNNIAIFNGTVIVTSSSASFGTGITGSVSTLFSNGTNFMAIGGRLKTANDTAANLLAYIQNERWTRVVDSTILPTKITLANNKIYFTGYNVNNKGIGIYTVTGNTIDSLMDGILEITEIFDLITIGNNIIACGNFYLNDIEEQIHLILWTGNKWVPLPNGDLLGPRKLAEYANSLIVSGLFVYHNTINYNRIAQYLSNYALLNGRIYFDKDRNCEFNGRDELLSDMLINIEPGNIYVKPNENGFYFKFLPQGEYTVKIIHDKSWESVSCSSNSQIIKITDAQLLNTIDFPLVQKTGIRNLAVKLTSSSGWSVNKTAKVAYTIQYQNKGSENVSSTQVVLHYDSKLVGLNASPLPDFEQGDSAVWIVKDLYAGEARNISCVFTIDNTASQALTLTASIPLQQNEEDQYDNVSELQQELSQLDYEFKKEVFPGASDTAFVSDSSVYVEYQISFANFTADTIFNVYVIDTIRLNHSLSIIQTTGASHPVQSEAFPGLAGQDLGIIVWTFKDINLIPNPTHSPEIVAHKGYVTFKLGLKQGLSQGTILSNRGNVVFDYYDEEATNWVYCIVNNQLSSVQESIEIGSLGIYPNPAGNELHLKFDEHISSAEFQIYGCSGQLVSEGTLSSPSIDIQSLDPGIYYLSVLNNHKHYGQKFIKAY